MCNTPTEDVTATLAQLRELAVAGAQIGRLAVPTTEAALALATIVRASPLPLVADIHFDYRLALQAVEAGAAGLRLNPGNIGGKEKVRQVTRAAAAAHIPIRIGVNGGSLEKEILQRHGKLTAQAMVESAMGHVRLLEELGFYDIKISLKATDLAVTLDAYHLIAAACDYPLHIGVTEAGTHYRGSVKSALGLGILLAEGIGDTLRVSLTADPVQEVLLAKEILNMLGVSKNGWNFISCPTCGRTAVDIAAIAEQVEWELSTITPPRPLTVAVMGCAVNGPGEARDADIGIAAGKESGLLFIKGNIIGSFPAEELAPLLIAEAKKLCGL